MSQFFISTTSGNLPPSVPTQFNTQNGNATPLANILIINGFDSSENNDNGIITKGGVAGTGTVNEVDVVLTNRITGTVTTTNATPTTLVTVSLGATPGVYYLQGNLIAYNVTDAIGSSYSFEGAAYTNGVAGTEIGTEERSIFEPAAMAAADFSMGVTGNSAFLEVTGIVGKTINWNGFFTYRFVG